MKITKTLAFILAMTMIILVFAGCNSTKKEVVAKIDGTEISREFFEIAIKQSNMYFQQRNFDISQMLEQKIDGEKTGAMLLKEEAMNSFLLFAAVDKLAADNNVQLSDADKESIKSNKEQQIDTAGGRAKFIENLEQMGVTEEYFDYVNKYSFMYSKLHNELFHVGKPMAPKQEDIVSAILNGYVRAKHILIQTTEDAEDFEQKKASAEAVLARAKAGEDFDTLITEFNEDPGMQNSPNGYVFNEGKMDPAFESATYALKDNEISGLVQSSYGFHIIKRLPLTEAFITENIEEYSEEFEATASQEALTGVQKGLNVEYTDVYDEIDVAKVLGVESAPPAADDNAPIQLEPTDGNAENAENTEAPSADAAPNPAQ